MASLSTGLKVARKIWSGRLPTPDGSVAKLEERIATNELPAAAQQTIHEKYPNGKVRAPKKSLKAIRLDTRPDVRKGGKSFDLVFDAGGKMVSAR